MKPLNPLNYLKSEKELKIPANSMFLIKTYSFNQYNLLISLFY